jgi:outer membrane protein OmpA-like peptidoglycan-associated protein
MAGYPVAQMKLFVAKSLRPALFRYVHLLSLLLFCIASCARVTAKTGEIITENRFSKISNELATISPPERVGDEELVVRMSDVTLFAVDQYELNPGAERTLQALARILQAHPEFIVIVEGHTDSRGQESYNQWLSERRSRAVADFLVREGLDPYRIQVVGYGESRPLTTDNTPEGRRLNRRVELHIKPGKP